MRLRNLNYKSIKQSRTALNSFWGIIGSGAQTLLLSLFFIILARKYTTDSFALFLVAMAIYQFLSAFSTLGLGQWFTRAIVKTDNKDEIVNKFLKIQLISGVAFYVVNIAVAFLLYDDPILQQLALILGINIIFDNVIYGIKALNIAEFQQKRTFTILFIDSFLKFLAASILFFYPLSILTLSILLIAIRLLTLNIFIQFGSSSRISFKKLFWHKVLWSEIREIIRPNWAFVVIGSVSIIYWRIGNLIISKTLPLDAVANYEVSYKVLSVALIAPAIVSTTVFPALVEKQKAGDIEGFKNYFHRMMRLYIGYSLATFCFFYSFSDFLIPAIFGPNFAGNAIYTKQMFLAVLVFPAVLLQANVLIALHREKIDMWMNIASLVINVSFCFIGLYFYKSLTIVNLAIFTSFLVFHILQDVFLVRNRISDLGQVISVYLIIGGTITGYVLLSRMMHPVWLFLLFLTTAIITFGLILYRSRRSNSSHSTIKEVPAVIKSLVRDS